MFDMHLAKKGGKIIAVVDIGSGSVGMSILSVHRGVPVSVIAVERVVLPVEERSQSAILAKLGEALHDVAGKIAQKKAPSPSELYCVVHVPWVRSVSTRAFSHFQKDTLIQDSMISALAQEALGKKVEINRDNLLEASAIRIELNGYPVGEPAGKMAHDIALTALLSDCDADLRKTVQDGLQHAFPQLTVAFRSSTRALLAVLREYSSDEEDCLVVSVGSQATSLVAIRGGVVSEQHLVTEGTRNILQRVAPGGIPEETLSLIRMLEKDECSSAACTAIQESMARAEPDMVRVFGEGMAACASVRKLPNKLLLIAHPDISAWLSKFFARIDFTQFTQTTQPFITQTLSSKDLEKFVMPEKGVVIDTGLAISAALVNIEKNRT